MFKNENTAPLGTCKQPREIIVSEILSLNSIPLGPNLYVSVIATLGLVIFLFSFLLISHCSANSPLSNI